jgi:hypothetical protein
LLDQGISGRSERCKNFIFRHSDYHSSRLTCPAGLVGYRPRFKNATSPDGACSSTLQLRRQFCCCSGEPPGLSGHPMQVCKHTDLPICGRRQGIKRVENMAPPMFFHSQPAVCSWTPMPDRTTFVSSTWAIEGMIMTACGTSTSVATLFWDVLD